MRFRDRSDAGHKLGAELAAHGLVDGDSLVVALPRGGVPVAAGVALDARCDIDLMVVRKLGVPGHEEVAMGAVASGGFTVLNPEIVRTLAIDQAVIDGVASRERIELERRECAYRGAVAHESLSDRAVVLVDDGIATGASMRVAVLAARAAGARSITVAVPVAPTGAESQFHGIADAFFSVMTPSNFGAVGSWYDDFRQTTDDEVREALALVDQRRQGGSDSGSTP